MRAYSFQANNFLFDDPFKIPLLPAPKSPLQTVFGKQIMWSFCKLCKEQEGPGALRGFTWLRVVPGHRAPTSQNLTLCRQGDSETVRCPTHFPSVDQAVWERMWQHSVTGSRARGRVYSWLQLTSTLRAIGTQREVAPCESASFPYPRGNVVMLRKARWLGRLKGQ